MRGSWILVCLVLVFGGIVSGAVICEAPEGYDCWYVAVDGSDSNNGSFDSPFGTIQFAVDLMSGGDIVYLRGGVHKTGGTVYIADDKDGTCLDIECIAGSWSTLKSYPGEWAVVDGENECDVLSETPRGVISSRSGSATSYWKFEKLEIVNGSDESGQNTAGLRITLGPVIIRYCYIHNNFASYSGNNPSGIYANALADSIIEYNYFTDNGFAGITDSGNYAHVALFTDYNQDEIGDIGYDGVSGLKNNNFRYNLLEGNQKGFKQKGTQFFTSRREYDDTYKDYGDKVHHNIFRNMSTFAIESKQDFTQIYNNILDNADGIRLGMKYKQYKQVAYNNLIIDGSTFDESVVHTSLMVMMENRYDYEDDKMYGYVYNNIIENGNDEWFSKEITLGVSQDNYAVNHLNNWDDFYFDNNYVYSPPNEDIITVFDDGLRNHFTFEEFQFTYPQYTLYENDYNPSDLLYIGTTGTSRYVTRADHALVDSVTIANGGVGGPHPYLDGVQIPSYVGAVNPDDNDWVDGVSSLAEMENGVPINLRDAPDGDAFWIEGAVEAVCEVDGDGDGYCLENDCDDDDPLIWVNVSCVWDGEICGNFLVCGSCLVVPEEICGNDVDEDCDGEDLLCSCVHDADLVPCDGVVSTGELGDYIELWLGGGVSMGEVMGAIGAWVH